MYRRTGKNLQRLAREFDRAARRHREAAENIGGSPEPDPRHEDMAHHLVAHADVVCKLAHELRHAAGQVQRGGGRRSPSLTGREQQVLRLIAEEGLTNREIAARLGIRPRTVESHVEHVYSKLGLHSRAKVTAWYLRTMRPHSQDRHDS